MTDKELRAVLDDAQRRAPRSSYWRHRKGGLYVVSGAVLEESTRRALVVYQLYDRGFLEPPVYWSRPLEEFLDGRFTRYSGEGDR